MTGTRAVAVTAGRCSFCGGQAERGISVRWWHLGQHCDPPAYMHPVDAHFTGFPARFIAETGAP